MDELEPSKAFPAFHHFLICYWHQNYDDFYVNVSGALEDFYYTESSQMFQKLKDEFNKVIPENIFPETIEDDHSNVPDFWKDYDAVIDKKGYHELGTKLPLLK